MMRIEQLMARDVRTCHADEPLAAAARIMWENDCGCVPVVGRIDGDATVIGMITDRDVCMAAYTQGRPLSEIKIESAMARDVRSCRASDSVDTALRILQQNQLHRLPVLDQHDRLVGMLSMADLAREAAREHGRSPRDVTDARLGETIESISQPRSPRQVAVAA